jgi:RNA polymerase sigma-70 factor (ECF subfamily)
LNNTNETKLLEKVCSLDPAAITDVYDRYSPGIYRYAMRLTGSAEQAEDCLAETFSRFLIALHDGRGPRKFLQAYLYRIAHNWITDLYRRNLPLVELDEQQLAIDETGNQPVLSFDLKSQQQRVRWALAQLKAEQRQAIVLRYLEEWEIDEIAHSLKKPAGAVRALLHRAVVKLRELLHGEKVENENEYKRKIFI